MYQVEERPMPQADPASVRLAAAQASAVSNELQRIKSQLTGAAAGGGWTGTARLAFDVEMADRIRQFDPVIARYDGYAASLISYARALEQTLPSLQQARRRLLTASSKRQSSPDGTDPPEDLNQEFDRLWRDWDGARRTCMSALERAARNAADRHGLSALWHSATHLAHEVVSHVNLAEISKSLSELGDVLFVAALVLSPVPGVGELLWTAVTIVAVAKLAVDGARMASGDKHVSAGDLAWDAVAALPGGKGASKAAREAAGLEKTVRIDTTVVGLKKDAKFVNLVPGGGLQTYEGIAGYGGHTQFNHVGRSYDFLVSRFRNPLVFRSSTYTDRQTAEHLVSGALHHADGHIQAWLKTGVPKLILLARSDDHVGITVSRFGNRAAKPTKNFVVILERKAQMPLKFRIPTSFPAP